MSSRLPPWQSLLDILSSIYPSRSATFYRRFHGFVIDGIDMPLTVPVLDVHACATCSCRASAR